MGTPGYIPDVDESRRTGPQQPPEIHSEAGANYRGSWGSASRLPTPGHEIAAAQERVERLGPQDAAGRHVMNGGRL